MNAVTLLPVHYAAPSKQPTTNSMSLFNLASSLLLNLPTSSPFSSSPSTPSSSSPFSSSPSSCNQNQNLKQKQKQKQKQKCGKPMMPILPIQECNGVVPVRDPTKLLATLHRLESANQPYRVRAALQQFHQSVRQHTQQPQQPQSQPLTTQYQHEQRVEHHIIQLHHDSCVPLTTTTTTYTQQRESLSQESEKQTQQVHNQFKSTSPSYTLLNSVVLGTALFSTCAVITRHMINFFY